MHHGRYRRNVQSEALFRKRVVRRHRAAVHADHVIAGRNVIHLKVAGILRDDRAPPLAIIQRQMNAGQPFRVRLPLAFKSQIVEHAARDAGKINDAKIHHANPLPDQVHCRQVLGCHPHRAGKLGQAQGNAVFALRDVTELVPALLVCLGDFPVVEPHSHAHQPLFPGVVGAVHVGIAKDAAFNDAAGVSCRQQRSRQSAEALGEAKIHERGALHGVRGISQDPYVGQPGVQFKRRSHLVGQRVSRERRPGFGLSRGCASKREIRIET